MSEITELAIKQGREMYELGRKHGATEELKQIEELIIGRLRALKGNWPSDYNRNNHIGECIHEVREAIKERTDEIDRR